MGVKGLLAWLKKINEANNWKMIKSFDFKNFKKLTIAIDASFIIYQSVLAIRSSGRDMKNSKGQLTSHLYSILFKILKFLENCVTPIFVFDGKAPAIKAKTIEKRQEIKHKARENLQKIDKYNSDDEEHVKIFKRTFTPKSEDITNLKIMLDLIGIPYIDAPEEADVVCAWLVMQKDENNRRYVNSVFVEDGDLLVLGVPFLIRYERQLGKNNNEIMEIFSLEEILKRLKFSLDQFQDMAVISGTDYCDRIEGYGPAKAYKLIQKHGNLKSAIKSLKLENLDINCYLEAKKYFQNSVNDLNNNDNFILTDDNLKLRNYLEKEFINFMTEVHNFDIESIKNVIIRLNKCYRNLNVKRDNSYKYQFVTKNNIDIDDYSYTESDSDDWPK